MKPDRLHTSHGPCSEIAVFPAIAQTGYAQRLAVQLASLPEDRRARLWTTEQNRIRGQLVAAGITDRKTINAHLMGFHAILVAAMDGAAPGPQRPARAPDPKPKKPSLSNPALAQLFARAVQLLQPAPETKALQLEFDFDPPTDGGAS